MLAPASGKSLTDPALVCQQVGPSSGHVAEIGRARYFFGSGPAAPADMTLGDPGDPGYQQPAGIRTGAVSGCVHYPDLRESLSSGSIAWPAIPV
jgi:hypothetical protein